MLNNFRPEEHLWQQEVERQLRQMTTWWQQLWKKQIPQSDAFGGEGPLTPFDLGGVPQEGGGADKVGLTASTITAPSSPGSPTTFTVTVYDPDTWIVTGETLTVTNRDTTLSASASGKFAIVGQIGNTNYLKWLGC